MYLQRVLAYEAQHCEAAVTHVTRTKMCKLSEREDLTQSVLSFQAE